MRTLEATVQADMMVHGMWLLFSERIGYTLPKGVPTGESRL